MGSASNGYEKSRNVTITNELTYRSISSISYGSSLKNYTLVEPLRLASLYMDVEDVNNTSPISAVRILGHGNYYANYSFIMILCQ